MFILGLDKCVRKERLKNNTKKDRETERQKDRETDRHKYIKRENMKQEKIFIFTCLHGFPADIGFVGASVGLQR